MQDLVKTLSATLQQKGLMLATAESCTGGMVAMAVTEQAGSSSVFDRGFVTYSNESKEELLGVSREILENKGAVSRECAEAMVQGVLAHSSAGIALSITGIAGPGGATARKPVGLVYIGCGLRNQPVTVQEYFFKGSRIVVRQQSAEMALRLAQSVLGIRND